MRPALRLLASLSKTGGYLEAGAPTGLAGLLTHASPRSTLLYLYSTTLDALKQLPEHSVYRQSTEALTKHRMNIVESVQPEGLSAWQERVGKLVDEHPEAFRRVKTATGNGFNIVYRPAPPEDFWLTDEDRINAPYKSKALLEGPRMQEEIKVQSEQLKRDLIGEQLDKLRIEAEPPLTLEQVNEIETKIGAGLIEEVIQVAEGERGLVETMKENKVWDDLEEKPAPGQWVYNERKNM